MKPTNYVAALSAVKNHFDYYAETLKSTTLDKSTVDNMFSVDISLRGEGLICLMPTENVRKLLNDLLIEESNNRKE